MDGTIVASYRSKRSQTPGLGINKNDDTHMYWDQQTADAAKGSV